jgi:hypothetical protein
VTTSTFPPQITKLPPFDGPFDAYQLAADGCDALFASYPAGTVIGDHQHDTDNVGVITSGELILAVRGIEKRYRPGDWYHVAPYQMHAARFETDTSEIEFWFRTGSASDGQR